MKKQMPYIIMILLLIVCITPVYAALGDGLVSVWQFNDSSVNDTLKLNNGTITGANLKYDTGKFGNALNTSGGSYVAMGNKASLACSATMNCSVSFWLKIPSGLGANQMIFTADSPTAGQSVFDVRTQGTNAIALFGYPSSGSFYLQDTGTTGDNTWHHVVVIYDSANKIAQLYVDNRNYSSGNWGAGNSLTSQDTHIFSFRAGSNTLNTGAIDEIYFYNRTLNHTEALTDLNTTFYPFSNPPITTPNIIAPINETYYYNNSMLINYTAASGGSGIAWYNISLYNTDNTFNMSIVNNSNNLNYTWTPLIEGRFKIGVTAFDTTGANGSTNFSGNITIKSFIPRNISQIIAGVTQQNNASSTYRQTYSFINLSVTDYRNTTTAALTILDPDGINILSAQAMNRTLLTNNNYSFTTLLNNELNKTGVWNFIVNITSNNGTTEILNNTVNVTSSPAAVPQNLFVYDYNNITTTAQIDTDSIYGFNIIGINVNQSNFSPEWSSALVNMNYSKSVYNQRVMLRLLYDGDIATNTAYYNQSCTNVINNLSTLKTDTYYDDVSFIVIKTYNQANNVSFTNYIAKCIVDNTNNRYPIFSESSNSGFTLNYVSNWTMPRLSFADNNSMLTQQKGYLQNSTTKTRVYSALSSNMKYSASVFQTSLINKIRGTIINTTTNITTSLNDIIFINNASGSNTLTLSVPAGKDSWDSVNKLILAKGGLNASKVMLANTYTYVIVDNLDHLTSSTIYKGSGNASAQMTWYTGTGIAGSFTIGGANSAKVTMWDPQFIKDSSLYFHSYEQLAYSYNTNFSAYNIIVISVAGPNTPTVVNYTLNVTVNTGILNKTYGYISVADYTNTDSWTNSKKTEIDNIVNNYSMNIFIDGLDSGSGGTNFSSRLKDVTDYARINKLKQVILNDYTAYQTVSAYGDLDMKESFCGRWNQTTGDPYYYYENVTIDRNRALWAQTSNHPQLAMAFGNESDYNKLAYCYAEFLVLYGKQNNNGQNNYFRYAQPDFQVQREIRVVDAGTQLESAWTEVNSTYWYRTYSNGRVWINPVANTWAIENSRSVTNLQICTYAQIGAGVPVADYTPINFQINRNYAKTYNITPTEIGANPFDAKLICKDVSASYSPNGRYEVIYYPQDRLASLKLNLWNENAAKMGTNSYYDTNTPSYPTQEAWSAYGRTGTYTDINTTNWRVFMNVSSSTSTGVDIHNMIQENLSVRVNSTKNFTITSNNDYNLSYWSGVINLSSFSNLTRITYAGTNVTFTNTSDCLNDIPTWTNTTISAENHSTCYLNLGPSNMYLRIRAPHLSNQTYVLYDNANALPTVNFTNISNNTHSNETITFNISVFDADVNNLTVNMQFYSNNNNTYNQSTNITGNGTIQYMILPQYFWYNATVYANISVNDSLSVVSTVTNNVSILVYPPELQYIIVNYTQVARTQDYNITVVCSSPGGNISSVLISTGLFGGSQSSKIASLYGIEYNALFNQSVAGTYIASAVCNDTAGNSVTSNTILYNITQPAQTQPPGTTGGFGGGSSAGVLAQTPIINKTNASIYTSSNKSITTKINTIVSESFNIINPNTQDKMINITVNKKLSDITSDRIIFINTKTGIDYIRVPMTSSLMNSQIAELYTVNTTGLNPGVYNIVFDLTDDTGKIIPYKIQITIKDTYMPQVVYDVMNNWERNGLIIGATILLIGIIVIYFITKEPGVKRK